MFYKSPLLFAAQIDIEIFKLLCENGANLKSIDNNKNNALHISSKSGKLDIVEFCIKLGLPIDSPNSVSVFVSKFLCFLTINTIAPCLFRRTFPNL